MSNNIKVCPCCGGEAELEKNKYKDMDITLYRIYCKRCFIQTDKYTTKDYAIKIWNNRNNVLW